MDLYIIRHGPAGKPSTKRYPDDGKRPLTRSGRRKMRDEGRSLRRMRVRMDWIFTSPLVRAMQTAALISRRLRVDPKRFKCTEHLLPDAPFDGLLDLLRKGGPNSRVGLFGHQPHLGRLVAWLLAGGSADGDGWDIKKGGLVHLRLTWPEPPAGKPEGALSPRAELISALPPRILRRL